MDENKLGNMMLDEIESLKQLYEEKTLIAYENYFQMCQKETDKAKIEAICSSAEEVWRNLSDKLNMKIAEVVEKYKKIHAEIGG